ncbi:DUF4173 domain-containing protein [Candidatus Peregrinibacteria bacterium]|nr:DUF4173 domain-containing protein [Candidatus Peregrinibacteria bacterium]
MNDKKEALHSIGLFSLVIAVSGSFLVLPFSKDIGLSFFLWSLCIFLGNILILWKTFHKLQINFVSIVLILSYLFLSSSFVINTQNHFPSIFFLVILLPILNIHLLLDAFWNNSIFQYFSFALHYVERKFVGVFEFFNELFVFHKEKGHFSQFSEKFREYRKIGFLFLIFGIPVITVVVRLLKSANAEFSLWIEKIFSFVTISDLWIHRGIFILVAFVYFLTEIYFLKSAIHKTSNVLPKGEITMTTSLHKTWIGVMSITIIILNVFLILFVVAELKYDFGNISELIEKKGYDSYSELAVSRFWELIFVSIINLGLVSVAMKSFWVWNENLAGKRPHALRFFFGNIFFFFLNTLFLILSSHQRLSLYESGYGFTFKRLLSHSFLPVLTLLSILIFSGFLTKKYRQLFHISFGVVILFFSAFYSLPTDYIVNKINFHLATKQKIALYDPLYTVPQSGNDVSSNDGFLVAIDVLNSKTLANAEQKNTIAIRLKQFEKENRNISWRETNFLKFLILEKLRTIDLNQFFTENQPENPG